MRSLTSIRMRAALSLASLGLLAPLIGAHASPVVLPPVCFGGTFGATSNPATPPITRAACYQWLVPLTGRLSEILIDPSSQFAYASNWTLGEVDVVSLQQHRLVARIPTGARPAGMSFTPDGKTLLVADFGADALSVIGVPSNREERRIALGLTAPVHGVVTAANGKVFITNGEPGISGYSGKLRELNLATGASVVRSDFGDWGGVETKTTIAASGDRSRVVFADADADPGLVTEYNATTDRFSQPVQVGKVISGVSMDSSGSATLVNGGAYVLGPNLSTCNNGPLFGHGGTAIPSGSTLGIGYALDAGPSWSMNGIGAQIDAVDLHTGLLLDRFTVTDTNWYTEGGEADMGDLAASRDAHWLALATDRGLSIVDVSGTHAVGL